MKNETEMESTIMNNPEGVMKCRNQNKIVDFIFICGNECLNANA